VNIAKIQHIDSLMNTNVYVESLISLPCSYWLLTVVYLLRLYISLLIECFDFTCFF
jgi:hypothetical protein